MLRSGVLWPHTLGRSGHEHNEGRRRRKVLRVFHGVVSYLGFASLELDARSWLLSIPTRDFHTVQRLRRARDLGVRAT